MDYYESQRKIMEKLVSPKSPSADESNAEDGDYVVTQEQLSEYKKTRREVAYTIVGSANYIAPEVLIGEGHDHKCDLWSLGVILFEFLWGFPTFHHKSPSVTRKRILTGKFSFPVKPENISHAARDLVQKLLQFDCKNRPSIEQIKSHAWFQDVIDWENLRDTPAPWVPPLQNDIDTSCFAHESNQAVGTENNEIIDDEGECMEIRKRMAFKGFTFKSFPAK
jgi:serine/threonine protein kinase